MFYFKFSKLSKTVIIINVILTILVSFFYGYILHRTIESYELVDTYMEEHSVSRSIAMLQLEKEGVELVIGGVIISAAQILFCITILVLLYMYATQNTFSAGLIACLLSFFTTFIGGFMLSYVFFSHRREVSSEDPDYEGTNDWSKFIHKRVVNIDEKELVEWQGMII